MGDVEIKVLKVRGLQRQRNMFTDGSYHFIRIVEKPQKDYMSISAMGRGIYPLVI